MKEGFPAVLSRLRREKGVNQRVAAAELNISQALLSHYENGLREPGLEFIAKACAYYGVSADFLLGRTEVREGLMARSLGTPAKRSLAGICSRSFSELLTMLDEGATEETLEAVADVLATTLYKLYRMLGSGQNCVLPEEEAFPLCRAALVLDELRLTELRRNCNPLNLQSASLADAVESRLLKLKNPSNGSTTYDRTE